MSSELVQRTERSVSCNPCVQALLMPGKIQHVLSPGDLCVKARLTRRVLRPARVRG